MKKLVTLLCCAILSFGLVACGENTDQPTDGQPQVSTMKFDCFEFDTNTEQFTDNIIMSVTLTDNFEVVPKESLDFMDPTYYIGTFKKSDEEGNLVRSIKLYEYTDTEFNLSTDCLKVSDNWYILASELDNSNDYIRTFYTHAGGYIVGLDIVNNTKENLTIDDSLALITFMTGEECTKPSAQAKKKSATVEGSLENPARTHEYVSTTVYNNVSGKYEPICISITNVYNGEIAQSVVDDYNNKIQQDLGFNGILSVLTDARDNEFVSFEYAIFFPSEFTLTDDGRADFKLPISICNRKDDGKGIDGTMNLDQTLKIISPDITDVTNESIWYDGVGFFEMSKDFEYYYIKIESDYKLSDTKYFSPE